MLEMRPIVRSHVAWSKGVFEASSRNFPKTGSARAAGSPYGVRNVRERKEPRWKYHTDDAYSCLACCGYLGIVRAPAEEERLHEISVLEVRPSFPESAWRHGRYKLAQLAHVGRCTYAYHSPAGMTMIFSSTCENRMASAPSLAHFLAMSHSLGHRKTHLRGCQGWKRSLRRLRRGKEQ